jgi:hypothetical protein
MNAEPQRIHSRLIARDTRDELHVTDWKGAARYIHLEFTYETIEMRREL